MAWHRAYPPAVGRLPLKHGSGKHVPAAPAVAGPSLVLASPAPAGPGPGGLWVRCAGPGQADQQAAQFRERAAGHAGIAGAGPPFSAWALPAASQARASMDKVTCACQARQARTGQLGHAFVDSGPYGPRLGGVDLRHHDLMLATLR